MTSNHFKILLILVVFMVTQSIYSQDIPPPGDDPTVPITEWLLILGVSGAVYGFRKKLKK